MIPIKKFSFFRNSGSCENSSLLPDVYQFLKCVAATENGVQAFTQFQTISTFCEVIATRKTGTVHEFCEGILCNMFGLFGRRWVSKSAVIVLRLNSVEWVLAEQWRRITSDLVLFSWGASNWCMSIFIPRSFSIWFFSIVFVDFYLQADNLSSTFEILNPVAASLTPVSCFRIIFWLESKRIPLFIL